VTANRSAETKPSSTPRDNAGRADAPKRVHAVDSVQASEHAHDVEQQRAMRQSFWRWGRIVFVLASIFLVVQLLHMVQGIVDGILNVLLLLLFGGLVAVVLVPIDRVLNRRMPATLSALLSLLAALVVVGGVGYAISIGVIREAQSLPGNLPRLERPFQELQQFLSQHGINVSIGSVASSLGINTSGNNVASAVISALSFTVQLLVDIVIVVVTTFWLLRDRLRLRRGLLAFLPARWRVETEFGLDAFVVVFGGYIRGQLVLALLVGLLALGGCALLGVPFPFLVGFAAGIFELIPLAGPFIGGAVAVLFAFTRSPVLILPTIALFVVIHVVEGYVVAPHVQGRFVRLHPLVSLLSLLAGAYAGGFLGAFFAVPVASLVAVIARARLADLRETEPELFMMSSDDQDLRGRRRRLLGEYRVGVLGAVKRTARRLLG
jgi:predicted PurR-regulated permease PerM